MAFRVSCDCRASLVHHRAPIPFLRPPNTTFFLPPSTQHNNILVSSTLSNHSAAAHPTSSAFSPSSLPSSQLRIRRTAASKSRRRRRCGGSCTNTIALPLFPIISIISLAYACDSTSSPSRSRLRSPARGLRLEYFTHPLVPSSINLQHQSLNINL